MDAEAWKSVIATISAIVAVASALLAHRAKVQTRADVFEGQRDALILTMTDNDNRCSHLVLQCGFARKELERVLPFITEKSSKEQANSFLANIDEIEKITKSLSGREYNEDNLDALKYSEESLATVRRMARGEQLNSKHLAAESYDLIFESIVRFISRHEVQT